MRRLRTFKLGQDSGILRVSETLALSLEQARELYAQLDKAIGSGVPKPPVGAIIAGTKTRRWVRLPDNVTPTTKVHPEHEPRVGEDTIVVMLIELGPDYRTDPGYHPWVVGEIARFPWPRTWDTHVEALWNASGDAR